MVFVFEGLKLFFRRQLFEEGDKLMCVIETCIFAHLPDGFVEEFFEDGLDVFVVGGGVEL